MTLVLVSRHLGLIWVAVEATTLASAPLIYFHRQPRSLEATWKYLLICSVGIALALLGNFFLAVAAQKAPAHVHLTIEALRLHATSLDQTWLKAAFLLLVGYGTKMGLAPLHTWLPDAHSEAPSVISALLSGALLNCALLAILRIHGLLEAAGLGAFSGELLVIFGLFSMGVAAVLCSSSDKPTSNGCWLTPAWNTWGSWPWAPGSAGWRASVPCCTRSITPWPKPCCSWWPGTFWRPIAPNRLAKLGACSTCCRWVVGTFAGHGWSRADNRRGGTHRRRKTGRGQEFGEISELQAEQYSR
jgi:hypothetical protein